MNTETWLAYLAVTLDFLGNNQTCVLILDSKKSAVFLVLVNMKKKKKKSP